MRVLVIGSGGREHALGWKIAQSPRCSALFTAPGNAGTAEIGTNVALDIADHKAIIDLVAVMAIDFVVVGPDAPVVAGLGDDLRAAGIRTFCPSRAAGQLEGSKSFTKALCAEMDIPTAAWERFEDRDSALAHVRQTGAPIVVKADGLAAGKGVTVAMTLEEAEAAISACFEGAFGASGASVVIEDFMEGEEVSLFVLSDGAASLVLTSAQDHKRAFDGDMGPNTGGMGAYSPAKILTPALEAEVMARIVTPTIRGLAARGTPYQGVLYAGLMLTQEGPKLVEYNARFGDPETQAMLMRLESDLLELLLAVADGTLEGKTTRWSDDAALTVILAARGYPGTFTRGDEIAGLGANEDDISMVFHAGTRRDGNRLLSNGGRVLNVTARGASVGEAQERAYKRVDTIVWPEGFCRRDIGRRAVERGE